MAQGTHIVVGLDLRPSSAGAIRMAAWLAKTSSRADSLVGIHVLDGEYLRVALRHHHLDEVVDGAKAQADKVIAEAGASEHFSEVRIVRGRTAEKSLEAAVVYHAAGGLVVGRQAPAEGRHVLRLGRVARRLLRRLPGPTLVVPPDYDPAANDGGPVMLTTNMSGDAGAAAAFAHQAAERLGRELVIVHVVPQPDDYAAHYLPEDSLRKMTAEHQQEGEAALAQWSKDVGCGGAELVVRQGGVIEELVTVASERSACMVVTGSRRLSTFERVLLTSIGSEIAAVAPCPVAVVPPEDED